MGFPGGYGSMAAMWGGTSLEIKAFGSCGWVADGSEWYEICLIEKTGPKRKL
jgi:hypothetical protein